MNVREKLPARCIGCHVLSEPRPLGQTPVGWLKAFFADGRHAFLCGRCR